MAQILVYRSRVIALRENLLSLKLNDFFKSKLNEVNFGDSSLLEMLLYVDWQILRRGQTFWTA